MNRNKNLCDMEFVELVKKIKLCFTPFCGRCEKIRKPINTMIWGKVLPASQFASATLYRSGQESEKLKKHTGAS